MARRGPKGTWQVVLLLIAALVLWAIDQRSGSPSNPRSPSSGPAPAGTSAPASKPAVRGGYEEYTGCRLE